jgi:O-antigen/teichoic acid export membrane protein
MTGNPTPPVVAPRPLLSARLRDLRYAPGLRWLGRPGAYPMGVLIVTFLSVGTSLLAPRLLGPVAFGTFTLLTSLFQYASKTDLGLSQLADQKLTLGKSVEAGWAADILRARLIVGAIVLGAIVPIAIVAALITRKLPAADTALAIGAGGAFMIAVGPITVFRATSKVWEFTAAALLLHAGLTAPRLAGLVFAGVTGCFAALAIWFGGLAALLSRAVPLRTARPAPILPIVRLALPLFAFNGLWEIYLSANRWISAGLSSAEDFGLFAFGANLALTAIGMVITIVQVRYPKLLAQIAAGPPGSCSSSVEREALRLCLVLSGGAALAILAIQPMIQLLFPHFERATPATVALAVSCVPLGVVASCLPIVISLTPRPWAQATRIFLPLFIILLALMIAANWIGGIAGQAWACTAAGFALIISLVELMRKLGVVKRRSAFRIVFVQAAAITGLTSLALAVEPAAAETVPPLGWELAFKDEFKSLQLWDNETRSGIWEPVYPGGVHTHGVNELEYYIDPRPGHDSPALFELAPFSIEKSGLLIQARPIPDTRQAFAEHLPYASGLLTTFHSFSFTYGYVELRARVPAGKGLWPAFWLLPIDETWPPEIDVMEVLGQNTGEFHASVHTSVDGNDKAVSAKVTTPDLSEDFHSYAVKWTADDLVWYLDGRRVASAPTPADMNKPMYLLVNLAVGGWAQSPDSWTVFPAEFRIEEIRVFQPPPVGAVTSGR